MNDHYDCMHVSQCCRRRKSSRMDAHTFKHFLSNIFLKATAMHKPEGVCVCEREREVVVGVGVKGGNN
jgi:hypothetical protein